MRHVSTRLAWVLAVAASLLVLALLTGGVRDGPGDSAVAACLPVGDDDCDGFSGTLELHVGTLPLVNCGLAAWPADVNDSRAVDTADLAAVTAHFGKSILTAPVRLDMGPEPAGNGVIDTGDLAQVTGVFGQSC